MDCLRDVQRVATTRSGSGRSARKVLVALLLLCVPAFSARQQTADELWNAGRRVEAVEHMTQELAGRPADMDLRRSLAQREFLLQRFRAALEHLEPMGSDADPLRARALYFLGRYEAAVALLDADRADHVLLRISALEALGRTDEADACVARAARVLGEGDARVLRLEARRLARKGDCEAAIPVFRRALALDEVDGEALHGLGRCLLRSGRRDEALVVLERHRQLLPFLDRLEFVRRGVELEPAHAPNHAALADVERELGRFDRARASYERAMELAQPVELTPIALRYARLLSTELDDVRAAVALLDRCATRVADARLMVRAGDLLAAQGSHDQAIVRFDRALSWKPDDTRIQERLRASRAALADDGEGR